MMSNQQVLQEIFGKVYTSFIPQEDLLANYKVLLAEKQNLLIRLSTIKESRVSLESWEIDLLLLPELKDSEFPQYFSLEELKLIEIFKKAAYQPEIITKEEQEKLYGIIRNRSKIEEILNTSGNGLSLDNQTLEILISLINKRKLTVGKTIELYEELCVKLGLSKAKQSKKLEYKY